MSKVKKVASLVLALAMCFALTCTAFAASSPDTKGTITVDGIAGEQYSIYQIFDLTYTSDEDSNEANGDSYAYKVVDAWKEFITSYTYVNEEGEAVYLFDLSSNGYLTNADEISDIDEADSSVLVDFAKAALAYATGEGNIEATQTKTAVAADDAEKDEDTNTTPGTATFEDLNLGWYLVSSSLGTLCMLDSTTPNAEIEEKNPAPTISKYVKDVTEKDEDNDYVGEDDADVVDTLEYEIILENVANSHNLCLHDWMDSELSLKLDEDDEVIISLYKESSEGVRTALTAGTLTTSEEEDENGTIITVYDVTGGDYVIVYPGEANYIGDEHDENGQKCAFEIHFSDEFLAGLSSEDKIVVIYQATIDASGDEFNGDIEEFDNYAQITFGLTQSSVKVEAETYTYGFEIYKYTENTTESMHVFSADRPTAPPNETATDYYYLYYVDENGTTQYVELTNNNDGTYTYKGTTETQPASENENSEYGFLTISSDDDTLNSYTIYGLPDHTYSVGHLTEHGQEGQATTDTSLDRSSNEIALAGAEFVLSYTETSEVADGEVTTTYYAYFEKNSESGKYILKGWLSGDEEVPTEDEEGNEVNYTKELVSGENGMVYVEGLAHDTEYTLTETKAPDGYNLLTESITVKISVNTDDDGNTHYDSFTVTYNGETADDNVIPVQNNAGSELPSTGGIGTTIFYVVGCILVLGAVVVLVTRKRMGRE